jgi:hypothetical protein
MLRISGDTPPPGPLLFPQTLLVKIQPEECDIWATTPTQIATPTETIPGTLPFDSHPEKSKYRGN